MKAITGDLPPDEHGWAFEFTWDAMRATAHVNDPAGPPLRLQTTRGLDATIRFPELTGWPPRPERPAVKAG